MLSIADALASSRVKIVNITGGEPFLHPKLTNVIDHCHKHFKIVISTHGMFLNKELMSELTSKVDLIGVSLDTLVKDDAKLMRGKNYYLNKVLANIGLILSSNVGLKFNTIVTKHNKDSLKEIANFIRSLEYPNVTWKLYETTINNNVSKAGRLLKVPHNQFMSLIQELKAKHADLRIIYSDSSWVVLKIFEKIPKALQSYFREEKCALFAGSGISIISGLPSWSDIMNDIKAELEDAGRENLEEFSFLQLAQFYEDLFGRKALLDLLVNRIKKPGLSDNICHDLITRLPLRTIITTNWDVLLEEAYERIHGIRPTTIWKDSQVGFVSETQRPTIIKMHGCITDPDSLVFTEQDYFSYIRSHPLIVDLISTKLANSPMLFLGYSVNDLDFKLMLQRITNILGTLVPPKYILLANETNEEAEYLKNRKFSTILIKNKNLKKTAILKRFLERLNDDVAIYAYTKLDRAKILLRENRSQLQNAGPKLIIRNSTNLGAWAIPKVQEDEVPLFDLPAVDELEWKASKIWDNFYKKGVRFKCIYCINAEWMLRKYSSKHAEKRLRIFLRKLRNFDAHQVQIANKDSPFDFSQTIFDNEVLLQLTKATPDERTYTHAEVIRDKLYVNRQIAIFDSHFEAIKQSNLAEVQRQGIYDKNKSCEQNLHEFVIRKTKDALDKVLKTK